MYRRSPLSTPESGGRQPGDRSSALGGPCLSAARTDHTVHEPAPAGLWTINGASARGKRMSDQVTNKSAAAEQSQVRLLEMPPPSSISSSDRLLSRIAILLFILVAGLLTVFGYYASSICITVVLAGFLAILFDPLVVALEKLHLPRSVAAAVIVLAGMGLIGLLGHVLYGKAMTFAEELPAYTSKIQQTIEPISQKIQDFQQSVEHAGADATSDSSLGALQRNGFGTGNSLLARSRGKGFYSTPTLGNLRNQFPPIDADRRYRAKVDSLEDARSATL